MEEVSRHKCLIYDGHPSEQLPVVVPLLTEGLKQGWRCLYLGDPPTLQMVDTALGSSGVDTGHETRRGALIFSADRSHLEGGGFDPSTMVQGLRTTIDGAVGDGYQGLCATGDMKWELGDEPNFDRLLEYEALLEQVFHEKPLWGICQYHRSLVPAGAVRDALLTHQAAYIGEELNHDNLFYVPPQLLLEARGHLDNQKYGEWMCQQILRVIGAERKRDEVLQELRESEAQQRRLAEELAALNRDLERRIAERTSQLELANRNMQAFSYSVSHDLRAPLRAIKGFSQALVEDFSGALGEQGGQVLNRVLASATHMDRLIDSMLEMGRITAAELRPARVDLSALAAELVQFVRSGTPKRQVQVTIAEGLQAVGDATLIRTVLTNLIENAWKFTSRRESACIEIGRSGLEDRKPIFFVRDNGAGFEMEHAKRLFGVFQRLHRQDEFPGTGVGLATTARIVEKHGGRIWAESRPNQGTTFFFTLPGEAPVDSAEDR